MKNSKSQVRHHPYAETFRALHYLKKESRNVKKFLEKVFKKPLRNGLMGAGQMRTCQPKYLTSGLELRAG